MKTTTSMNIPNAARMIGAVLAIALFGHGLTVLAAASPPEFMTYQGYLADGDGDALGLGSPENYDVVFSIYKDQVGGNSLWSEQQTVTVDKGYFSVLLGEGGGGNISPVFSGADASERYIQIGVKGLNPGNLNEIVPILPRLKLVSSPYAYLATRVVADAIGSDEISDGAIRSADILDGTIASADILDGTITSDDILDNTITTYDILNNTITTYDILDETISSADILNNSITGSDILNSTITGSDIQDGTITSSDIQDGTITSSDLSSYLSSLNAGQIGIGTSSPSYPLEVTGYVNKELGGGFWYTFVGGGGIAGGGSHINSISIKASYGIQSGSSLFVTSDRRIKKNLVKSDPELDLDILTKLQVTDYNYIDVVGYGEQSKKGFIAQEVAEVYPQAVNNSTDVVPDIYESAACKDGWVELATDLKKGERVRLVSETEDGIYEVLDVTKDKFRTDFKPEGDNVIVYGREVDDFHAVDYDALAVLNISVTQTLVVQMNELKRENAELKIQMRELAKMVEGLVKTQP
jgi:hypothetical protein